MALGGVLVVPPAKQLCPMANSLAGYVIERHLDDQLGAQSLQTSSSSDFQRLGSPEPRSCVRYGSSLPSSSRFSFALNPEVWPTMWSCPSSSYIPRISEPRVPSSLPKRKAATTASAVRTRLIFTIPVRSPGL